MSLIHWTPAALRDVPAHTAYIADFNPRAADRLARDLITAANSLAMFPQRGRPGLVATTWELVVLWPYVLVYRIQGKAVDIVRVWHGAQDRQAT